LADPFFRLVKVGKAAFVASKCLRVVISPAVMVNSGVSDMQHFVKDHVLNNEPRDHVRI
jgi:hypothetical protein